ncbi:hypothetical protein ES703_35173 [subsurface metagenome]
MVFRLVVEVLRSAKHLGEARRTANMLLGDETHGYSSLTQILL